MLSSKEKKRLRAIGHTLNPIVTIAGNGFSDGVKAEIERALKDHELIKLKILADDRVEKRAIIKLISETHGAETVQTIGGVALIYRAATKPDPALSNILRSNIL